uniref:Uncharacterized protein n=1 Tax=Glossina palpalis gambiensis TaxID=67801 RepID=A0A1B0C5G2_9MUSC
MILYSFNEEMIVEYNASANIASNSNNECLANNGFNGFTVERANDGSKKVRLTSNLFFLNMSNQFDTNTTDYFLYYLKLFLASITIHENIKINGCSAYQHLNSEFVDSGIKLSLGHRRLLCLARVVLKRSICLVLDKATRYLVIFTERILLAVAHKAFSGQNNYCCKKTYLKRCNPAGKVY